MNLRDETFQSLLREALRLRSSAHASIEAVERADQAVADWLAKHHITRVRLAKVVKP